MAQSKSRGGRSRKRRSAPQGRGSGAGAQEPGAQATGSTVAEADGDPDARKGGAQAARPRQRPKRQKRPDGPLGDTIAFGERPQAPWHPLPLAEILILVGMIAMVIGATRGENGVPAIAAGIFAVVLGTYEFSWREHMSGYRSHAILLTCVPLALLFGVLAYAIFLAGAPTIASVVVPIFVDIALFIPLYRRLRARFRVARRARLLAAGL